MIFERFKKYKQEDWGRGLVTNELKGTFEL